MNSPTFHSILKRCRRLLTDYANLLSRHEYLSFDLTSIEQKILSSPSDSRDTLIHQEQEQLNTIEQRLKALQNDPWLDKLFSVAQNKVEVEEIDNLMLRWGQANYKSVAHCIVDHANRHQYPGNYLKYLRKAANFKKKRARKSSPAPGVRRWNKSNDEYLIEREGKIVSYGRNRPLFK